MTLDVQPRLDPFRSRQAPDVGKRWTRERDRHQRQSDLMWVGTLVTLFSDHELRLLDDLGFLSPRDYDLLAQAGRPLPRLGAARPEPQNGQT
jgi:hypothetical protein